MTVGTSSVEVAPAPGNRQRKLIYLRNISTGGQTITISYGREAVANAGFVLSPLDTISESIDPAFRPYNDRITAISSAAAGTLSIVERLME